MKDTGRWLVVSSRGEGENRLIYWLPDEETDLWSKDKKKRLKKLFFLNFSPRGRNSISTLSPSEAVSDLVDACHDFYEKRLSALDIVLAVIHQVESYRICYNQPDYALAGIENISKV